MRWFEKEKKKKPIFSDMETRVVRKFLWFPKKIGKETRWLEFASYEQIYYKSYFDKDHNYHSMDRWYDLRLKWMD